METVKKLIEKFNRGEATLSEKTALLAMLSNNDLAQLKDELHASFENNVASKEKFLEEEKAVKIFEQIQLKKEEINTKGARIINLGFKKINWAVAASIIAIITVSIIYFSVSTNKNVIAKVANEQLNMQQISNNGNTNKAVTLQDGSIVLISPNSTISFSNNFSLKRDINLIGKATFKVAKNAQKPFTVFANGVSTTALGTEFSVDAFYNNVVVKLLEGKVVVKPAGTNTKFSDTYLTPGEQCFINNQIRTFAVSKFSINKAIPNKAATAIRTLKNNSYKSNDIAALEFNKAPLTEVFSKIGYKYNKRINYANANLGIATFTGSFLQTDSLNNILTIICTTNDLLFKEENGIIIIYR